MAYVNEEILGKDYKKYSSALEDGTSDDWTIDREKGIWFRLNTTIIDREENLGKEICSYWDLYWKGYLICVKTEFLKNYGEDKDRYYVYIKLLDIKIPKEIEKDKEEILKELKKIFEISNAGACTYSDAPDGYTIDLEYEGRLI